MDTNEKLKQHWGCIDESIAYIKSVYFIKDFP